MFKKKKKYLPDDFEQLIEFGDIAALIKVFDVCSVDARARHNFENTVFHYVSRARHNFGKTALHYDGVPAELACWLVERGFDLSLRDYFKMTPLDRQLSFGSPIVKTLLELGACVDATIPDQLTPLHIAAASSCIDNTRLLIERGANIHAKANVGIVHTYYLTQATPLAYALAVHGCGGGSKCDIVSIAKTAELFLNLGEQITQDMREHVGYIGMHFEYNRNDDRNALFSELDENETALLQLYELFSVAPIPKRRLHDGVSPITLQLQAVAERKKQESEVLGYSFDMSLDPSVPTYRKIFNDLWDYLVPPMGPAKTAQGEVIRITAWLDRWIDVDVGLKWNDKLLGLFDILDGYFITGFPLSPNELTQAKQIFAEYREARLRGEKLYGNKIKGNKSNQLVQLAVSWVLKNPTPIPFVSKDY